MTVIFSFILDKLIRLETKRMHKIFAGNLEDLGINGRILK
jgi:hypothetical protein